MKRAKIRKWAKRFGAKLPEIAVLRLSNADYKLFVKQPKKFLIDHRIFRKRPNRVVRCGATPTRGGTMWVLFLLHVPNSTVSSTGWQI
jgi:hypothetical protein